MLSASRAVTSEYKLKLLKPSVASSIRKGSPAQGPVHPATCDPSIMMRTGCLNVVSSWDWGSVPEWVGGLGAVAALIWAIRIYRGGKKVAKIAQPRRVTASSLTVPVSKGEWLSGLGHGVFEKGTLYPPPLDPTTKKVDLSTQNAKVNVHRVDVKVSNHSDEPITTVHVMLLDSGDSLIPHAQMGLASIDPGKHVLVTFVFNADAIELQNFKASIVFTDSAGFHWSRREGEPVRALKENPYRTLTIQVNVVPSLFSASPGKASNWLRPKRPGIWKRMRQRINT